MRQTLAKAFGAAVRRLRVERGDSQEGFAYAAAISRTYMSEIERGVTNVSLETIERVADALDLSLTGLIAEVQKERERQ